MMMYVFLTRVELTRKCRLKAVLMFPKPWEGAGKSCLWYVVLQGLQW